MGPRARIAVAVLALVLSACIPVESHLQEDDSPHIQQLRNKLNEAQEECRERGGVFVVGRGSDKFKSCIAPEAIIELEGDA